MAKKMKVTTNVRADEINKYVALKRDGKHAEATKHCDYLLDKYKNEIGIVQLVATLVLMIE